MSLRSPLGYQIPEETVRVAQAAFPKGNLYLEMQAKLGMLYTNSQFASLFSHTGQPALDPARLALISVMQFIEDLSDEEAAEAVRSRIDWKYILALPLTHPGFDGSVLSEFRTRLIKGGQELLLLDTLLSDLQERGLLQARGRQRTDSTHVLAAVRTINRLSLCLETVRAALNALASVAPEWLRPLIQPGWLERYGPRAEVWRLPTADAERQQLASAIGADGFVLLDAVYQADTPPEVRYEPAVEVLRRVWLQQYYGPEEPPRWRGERDAPPPGRLIHSPYDVDVRFCTKNETQWVGYKVHYTETCDAGRPHVITHVLTTAATEQDDGVLPSIHASLAQRKLLPRQHLVDAGYTTAEHLVTSKQDYGIEVVGPVAENSSWQSRAQAGYGQSEFVVDWEAQVAICPQGKRSVAWRAGSGAQARGSVRARFAPRDCRGCAGRSHCTRAQGGRSVLLLPRAQHEALQQARQHQKSEGFKEVYRLRAGVESLVSQGVRAFHLRRSRYRGRAKTHLQHVLAAVAINLVRLVAWWREPQQTPRKAAAFARLAATA